MTKKEFLDVLIPELRRLEEVEHLRDLARNGRYDEAQEVLYKVKYSSLIKYCKTDNEEDQLLEVTDIPQEYLVTFILYLLGNKRYNENDIMRDWAEFQAAVGEQGEDGAIIAEKMNHYYLNNFGTIADLMEPDYEEEDEEDAVD